MLGVFISIIIIIIILIICCFLFHRYYLCNSPFGIGMMNNFKNNRHKHHFTANPDGIFPSDISSLSGTAGIINTSADVPSQFLPQNSQKRAIIGNNIQNLQGKVDKEYYGYYLPVNGGENIQLPYKSTCVGLGEDTTCSKTYGHISDGNSTSVSTGKIATAEQEMWMANRFSDGGIKMEKVGTAPADDGSPSDDYDSYVQHLVIDNRMRDNHNKWTSEMLPWAGTAMSVDNIDEAVANSLPFQGLRRPQAIVQDSNALYKTEIDASDFINNPKFRFNT